MFSYVVDILNKKKITLYKYSNYLNWKQYRCLKTSSKNLLHDIVYLKILIIHDYNFILQENWKESNFNLTLETTVSNQVKRINGSHCTPNQLEFNLITW